MPGRFATLTTIALRMVIQASIYLESRTFIFRAVRQRAAGRESTNLHDARRNIGPPSDRFIPQLVNAYAHALANPDLNPTNNPRFGRGQCGFD